MNASRNARQRVRMSDRAPERMRKLLGGYCLYSCSVMPGVFFVFVLVDEGRKGSFFLFLSNNYSHTSESLL